MDNQSVRWCDVFSGRAFVPGGQVEFNPLTFGQGLETFAPDFAVVNENIVPVFLRNKTVALALIEPLDGSYMSFRHNSSTLGYLKNQVYRSENPATLHRIVTALCLNANVYSAGLWVTGA